MQIPLWQRLLAPLVYLLPWSDAIPFGWGADGVFNQIPVSYTHLPLPTIYSV